MWRMTWYLAAAVVVGVGTLLLRRRAVRGPHPVVGTDLDGAQVGYLVGGPPRAVAAVLTGLRVAGAVRFTGGTLVDVARPPDTWGALGRKLHEAATGTPGLAGLLRRQGPVATELRATRDDLERRGWLVDDAGRARVRMLAAPMWALVVVGAVLVGHAAADDRPFGWQLVATGAVLYAAVPLSRVPELTAHGRAALDRLTEANAHLGPAANPSLPTYGAAAAAVAVGLFGTVVLLPFDPDLALAADLLPHAADEEAARTTGAVGDTASGGLDLAGGSCSSGGGGSGAASSCGSSCGGGCGGCGGE
jgi:uncharacterized protein (TIGR04222 family)